MSEALGPDRSTWPPDAVCSYEERAGILEAEGLPRPYAEKQAEAETVRWWALVRGGVGRAGPRRTTPLTSAGG